MALSDIGRVFAATGHHHAWAGAGRDSGLLLAGEVGSRRVAGALCGVGQFHGSAELHDLAAESLRRYT